MRITGFTSALTLLAIPLLASCSKAPDGGEITTTTTTRSDVSIGGLVTTHDETTTTTTGPAPEPAPADRPPPPTQSGNLTAGDYDDLLNPDLYARYAEKFLQTSRRDLPFVDTRTRVAIRVVDTAGHPVPQARVAVARAAGPLRLVTGSDGVASLYPAFDHVGAGARIDVTTDAGTATRTLRPSPAAAGQGPRTLTIAVAGQARPVSAMDLVLVVDTTGSMGDEMAYLKAELDSIVTRLKRETGNLSLRIGLIVYRDEGDDYVERTFPLTDNIGALRTTLADQQADGGGDMPEAVDRAMLAAERMQWRPDAAKAVLLIAEAPPHAEALTPTLASTERLRTQGVQIVPVAASGVEDSAQYVMRAMAALTQGRYIFLTDDSGIGNAHAEPDVACYIVTRLDQLIARVLAGIVEGRRIEPAQTEVIRAVGRYDAGHCRPVETASN